VQQGKNDGERGRRARDLRRLAVLPALGLGALALAVPAHAGDESGQPPVPSTHANLSVTIVVDPVEEETPDTQPAAAPVEASIDAAPAADPAPVDDAVRPVETPAKEAPTPTPASSDSRQEAAVPATGQPSTPPAAAPPPVAPKQPAQSSSARPPTRQYQPPKPQYQPAAAQLVGTRARHEAKGLGSKLRAPTANAQPGVPQPVRDIKRGGWNCAENMPQPSPLCPPDACEKSSWKCCWIDTCTSGIPVVETPPIPGPAQPETGASPATCTGVDPSGTQYQSGDGQYQPPPSPGDEDSGDDPDDDVGLDPCQQAPVVAPGTATTPPASSDTGDTNDAVRPGSEPVGPEATAATAQPPGAADSVSSTPPPADALPAARPIVVVAANKRVETAAAVVPAGAVLGKVASAGQARPHRAVVTRPVRLVRPKRATPRNSRTPERAVAAPARVSTPLAGSGSSLGQWFAFAAAALLAFGLSSVALVGRARPHASALAGVRARIGSRGLSSEAPLFPRPRTVSRGIRYRD
jgi:hypothetical protein